MISDITRYHFVGIGGSGMSALADILLEQGYEVTGSDLNTTATTERLKRMGARIFRGHSKENIYNAQAVVVSTAINDNNPEVQAAQEKSLPIFHRSDILAALMADRKGIAVAGAHGKTTTTSMIAVMLEQAGKDPTIVIGGEVDFFGGNAKLGHGQYLVAEADESDGSFIKLSPHIAVVTNIENDHMDYYGSMENILKAFTNFLNKLSLDEGIAVLCFDNHHVRDIASHLNRKFISYGIDYQADYMAKNIHMKGSITSYEVYQGQTKLGVIKLQVPGEHNVLNSLAAVAVGLSIGLDFDQIAKGLYLFKGAKRRFQTKAFIDGIWIVDDYAHHPTEIATTLLAAKQTNPKRLICVFQPHRYSRTKFLMKEFGSAFKQADILILTDIYAAGEQPIPGITGESIKKEVERQTGQNVVYFADKTAIAQYLYGMLEKGDLVITMGAGNVYQVGEDLIKIYEAAK